MSLERNIVVGQRLRHVRGGGGDVPAHALFTAASRGARCAAAATAAEEHNFVAAHLGALSLDALLVRVFIGLNASLDVHLLPFDEVLFERLCWLPPQVDVVPLGSFLPLARLVVPHFGGRDAELRDGRAAWRVAELCVASEVADQNHLVDAAHKSLRDVGSWKSEVR